jgi:hypothetical protein
MSLIPQAYEAEWTAVNEGVFNDGPGGGGYGNAGGSIADPTQAAPVPPVPTPGYKNPCTSTTIPINAGFNGPLLIANPRRSLLLLQNNSFATAVGDVPPVLWFAFGRPAVPGQCQGLAAATVANGIGEGLVLDFKVPRDTLYVVFGPSSNGGGTVQALGSVTEGIDDLDQDYLGPSRGGVAPRS